MSTVWLRAMSYGEDILQVVPAALLAGAVYLLLRGLWLARGPGLRRTPGEEAARFFLACWAAGLVALVCVPANFWTVVWTRLLRGSAQWVPVAWFSGSVSLRPFFADGDFAFSWQMWANVLLYLPLGLLLPAAWRGVGWRRVLGSALSITLGTELFQIVVGRSFDIDDLFANTLGAAAGYALWHLVRKAACLAAGRRTS